MNNCPSCDGTGKMKCRVHNADGKESTFEMECFDCGGTGKVSAEILASIEAEKNAWCSCGNPSGEHEFYDDGEDSACYKHHWNCKDCGKLWQVG